MVGFVTPALYILLFLLLKHLIQLIFRNWHRCIKAGVFQAQGLEMTGSASFLPHFLSVNRLKIKLLRTWLQHHLLTISTTFGNFLAHHQYYYKLITSELTRNGGKLERISSLMRFMTFFLRNTVANTKMRHAAKATATGMRYTVTGGPEEEPKWR